MILRQTSQGVNPWRIFPIKQLFTTHPAWKSYLKGAFDKEQVDLLISNKEIAATHAKKLEWPSNPSTNTYDFIEALEVEKIINPI